VPVITTLVPTLPLVGVKLVIVGVTLKVVELVAEPPLVVTTIFPVLQALGSLLKGSAMVVQSVTVAKSRLHALTTS
jgi:hypothetical protein